MGAEAEFGERLIAQLRPLMPPLYLVESRQSLLYAISFDDRGMLQLGQDDQKKPVRGRGTGFEQDLLVFERSTEGDTSVVPRISVELKFGGITTHDAIVYSEKARRIRTIYPFIRYGMILGDAETIPARLLRLGTEFDFILAVPDQLEPSSLRRVASLLIDELHLSQRMTAVLRGQEKIALLHRSLKYDKSV